MEKRFTFKCWNHDCQRTYTLLSEITIQQELIVACPYCNKEGVVRLGQYPRKKIVMKSHEDNDTGQPLGEGLVLPDVILTHEPAESKS